MSRAHLAAPRRIGVLIDRWNPRRGGAERALATFAAYLEARGHELFVFGLEGPPPGVHAPGMFIPVQTHGATRGARERRLSAALIAAASGMRCDLTIGIRHLTKVDFYWPHGGAHAATLSALRKRVVGRHRTFLDLERAAVADGGARRVICVSELVRDEMLDYYPSCAARLRVIPNGLDLERFNVKARPAARASLLELAGWDEGAPVLTFIARNAKLKGLPVLLKALRRVKQQPWRLVISGPREVRRWRRRAIAASGDRNRVFVTEQIDPLIAAAGSDLLVHPSRRDTSGLVVLEALATGTPVLISEAVGARDRLQTREQGELCAARPKPAELAAQLQSRLAGMQSHQPDRAHIAQATEGLDLEGWMTALEKALLDLAPPQNVG